jgi:hypothetical protein
MCWEVTGGKEVCALAVDVSSIGVRIERPYVGGPTRREVPLQLEVPGIDEIMWARGDACYDVVVPAPRGIFGLVRRTGYRLSLAAARDLRLLKELVFETHRAAEEARRERLAWAAAIAI